jgi:hypothetical protein
MVAPVELSASDTAGILDQIYRAAKGLPRRFYLTPERLKDFVGRKRLRTEFLDDVGGHLIDNHGIWMSYPRSSRRNVGFASWNLADSWQPLSQDDFRKALDEGAGLDRVAAATKRLIMIHRLNTDNRSSKPPVILTEQQFCEITQVERFKLPDWQELIDNISGLSGRDAVVIFLFGSANDRKFAISHQFHLSGWFQPSVDQWRDASKRYSLEEVP